MKFILEIYLTDSIDTDRKKRDSVKYIMTQLATKFRNPNLMDGKLRDMQGNVIGVWKFAEGKPTWRGLG